MPQYRKHFIPGSDKHKGNNTPYQIEDKSKSPSREYYFPVGYIPKPDKDSKDLDELIEKDSGKIVNITKHYRRYFKTDLESVKELKIKSPFYTAYLRRVKIKISKMKHQFLLH